VRQFGRSRLILVALICPLLAGGLKVKKIKGNANPPQYASFSKLLTKPEQIQHAANRLTLGARPEDWALIRRLGLKKWIDQQLHPEEIAENPELTRQLSQLATLSLSAHDTFMQYPRPRLIAANSREGSGAMTLAALLSPQQIEWLESGSAEQKKQVLAAIPPDKGFDFAWALQRAERQKLFNLAPVDLRRKLMFTVNPGSVVISDLSEGKLLRGIYSNRQLAEALDDFWFNHFNVFVNKGADRYLLPTYERETIRPHIFGTFYDLLLATAESPAMLFYLDNASSVAPGTGKAAKGKARRGLNENYGRELLELHTMGVDGGYTQKDVIEVARCFTGWTITGPAKGGVFEYRDRVHDKGQKTVLGHVIPAGGGMSDGLQVLQILAHSPSTAHFISLKLAERFVADDPPPSVVNRMAQDYLKSGGDLRKLMQTMLVSPEFWSQGALGAKVKTPFEMVVSAARATNAQVTSAYALENVLQKLGEPLYRKIEPTGYSNANAEWVSSSALLERMNFSLALAANKIPGVRVDESAWQARAAGDPMELARTILPEEPGSHTQEVIRKAPQTPSLVVGLALGSPEFQRK
jgi:uncharacterized protein (DUF1800 family)